MASAPVHTRSRQRPWLLRIVLGVVLLAGLVFAVTTTLNLLADADYNSICAHLDRTDPNWRLEDLEANRKELPLEENSALLVLNVGPALRFPWSPKFDKIFSRLLPQ